MNYNDSYFKKSFAYEIIGIIIAILFLVPFYFIFVNSFKNIQDILYHTASLPHSMNWGNFIRSWSIIHFSRAFANSLVITLISDVLVTIIAAMSAYRMVRHPSRFNQIIFMMFVISMVIPLQTIMIPLVQVMGWLKLINSFQGLILCYLGLSVSFSVFLFHGFVKSIPVEVEEAAVIDGCNPYELFLRVVFPLLKPMAVTVILLNTLWFWNEFILARLILLKPEMRTIQLATNSLFGEYTKQWDLGLAALVMGIMPAIVFFLSLQRLIIGGITSGAVKG